MYDCCLPPDIVCVYVGVVKARCSSRTDVRLGGNCQPCRESSHQYTGRPGVETRPRRGLYINRNINEGFGRLFLACPVLELHSPPLDPELPCLANQLRNHWVCGLCPSLGDRLCGLVVRLPGGRPRGFGFDSGATRFSG
jgi:hypothetical protein